MNASLLESYRERILGIIFLRQLLYTSMFLKCYLTTDPLVGIICSFPSYQFEVSHVSASATQHSRAPGSCYLSDCY